MFRRLILRQLHGEEDTEASRALRITLWILLSAFPLLLLGLIALPQFSTRWLLLLVAIYSVCVPAFILNRRGYTRFASLFLIVGLWLVVTGAALTAGGIASFAALYFLMIVFVSGLLLGQRAAIVTALVCFLTALGLVVGEITGHLPGTAIPHTPLSRWIAITILLVIIMGLQYLSVRRVQDALRLSRQELEDRKRTEQELRRVSERLQLATGAAGIGIWDWDAVKNELVWDDAMYRLFGIRKEDFTGAYDAWAKSLAPNDFERASAEVQAALSGVYEFASEFRIVWPDRSIHFIKGAAQTFHDTAGHPVRMVGVNYDITERKLAEERITLLQTITTDVAATENLNSALEVVLRRVCEKTGWSLGQAWVPRQDGTGLDCCPAWFATAPRLEEFRAFSRNITLSPGSGLPGRVLTSKQPAWIRDVTRDTNFHRAESARKVGLKAALGVPILSDHEVIAVLEFFLSEPREEDERLVKVIAAVATQIGLVIERKHAEEQLRWSEERLRLLLDSTAEGIFGIDLEGRCGFCNAASLRLLGYAQPSELLGKEMHELIASKRADGTKYPKEECPVVQSLLSGSSVFADDDVFWRKDGISFPAQYWSYPMFKKGKLIGAVVTFLDISERRLVEESLRLSEERFAKAFQASPEPITIFRHRDGMLLEVNERWQSIYGFTREEAVGHTSRDLNYMELEDRNNLRGLLGKHGFVREFEVQLRTKHGEIRHISLSAEQIIINGELCNIFLHRDITERRRAEEENRKLIHRLGERVKELTALHQTARILQKQTNSVPQLLQEIVELLPPAWQYPEVTAASITFGALECQTANFTPTQWSLMAEVTAGGVRGVLEVVYLEERPAESLGPFLSEERNLINSVAEMISSALNHKYSQEALRESERRFSDTLTNIEMIAVMADMNGNITFCNDYLLRLTGWKREEIIGRSWYEMFLPADEKKKVSEILDEVGPNGQVTIHLENAIKTRSGERRLVKWTNTTLRGIDGKVIGVAALGDDITERRKADEQLKASSNQLRALSERLRWAKEEEGIRIARELHDELGSALTSFKWSLLGLDKLYSGGQTSEAHSSARVKIDEMVALVDATFNTVRRISSELRPGVLDDLGLVPAIEWQAQQFQEQTGIVCRFDCPVDSVELDREQATTVFRIFQEGMTNILRHSGATKVNVLIEEEDAEFVLEINDNGRGITESEKLGLRSLGLLGMRERANSIGARIDINGTTGKGTKLIVRLGLKPEGAV